MPKKAYIFSIWGTIALTSSVVSSFGYTLFRGISQNFVSKILAVAAWRFLRIFDSFCHHRAKDKKYM
jgi:hypothetical protein